MKSLIDKRDILFYKEGFNTARDIIIILILTIGITPSLILYSNTNGIIKLLMIIVLITVLIMWICFFINGILNLVKFLKQPRAILKLIYMFKEVLRHIKNTLF